MAQADYKPYDMGSGLQIQNSGFEYRQRNPNSNFLRKPDTQDSLLLVSLVNSGTSFAMQACMTLQQSYAGYPCQYQTMNSQPLDIAISDCNSSQFRQSGEDESQRKFGNRAWLGNALPNPARTETIINYYVPKNVDEATLRITSLETGGFIEELSLKEGENYVAYETSRLKTGVYAYTLLLNGQPLKTQKLIILK